MKKPAVQTQRFAVGYVRVSTLDQAREGVSLDAQVERIRTWASAYGYQLLDVKVEPGLSAKRADNRPVLQEALALAKSKGAVLVAYSLSRIARNVQDAYCIAETLQEHGGGLASITESLDTSSAMGRMMFGFLAVLAQFERELTAERTSMALDHKKANGQRVSRYAPWGFCFKDGRLVPCENELQVIRDIKALVHSGMSYRAVARKLNADGVPSRGKQWHLGSIQDAVAFVLPLGQNTATEAA